MDALERRFRRRIQAVDSHHDHYLLYPLQHIRQKIVSCNRRFVRYHRRRTVLVEENDRDKKRPPGIFDRTAGFAAFDRLRVAAGRVPMPENVIDQDEDIVQHNDPVTIAVADKNLRLRRRTVFEDIVDEVDNVGHIDIT